MLFQDLVAAASAAPAADAAAHASGPLQLWAGEPWTPGDGYDWFERALASDGAQLVLIRRDQLGDGVQFDEKLIDLVRR